MVIDREELIDHLEHISCDEEITEVVLNPDLSVDALTPDLAFYVSAPGWGDDALPEPIGVIDLSLFIKSLKKLAEDTEVDLKYESNRLVLNEGVHVLRLMTSDPEVIGTRVEDSGIAMIGDTIKENDTFPIPRSIARGILDVQDLLGAMELTLDVGPKGTDVFIGPETGHNDVIQWPDLQDSQNYRLILQANAMVAALNHVEDYDEATITLTGPDSLVAIHSPEYLYVLSPTEE